MYIPRHHHYLFSLSIVLFGFWIKQKFGNTLDVWMTAGYLQFIGLMHGYYITQAGVMYQGYITEMNTPDPKPAKIEAEPVMPRVNMSEWKPAPQFENTVKAVTFDMERQFAKALLVMHDFKPNDAAVDMKEKKWVRPNKFKTRAEYVALLSKWEQHGLIQRKSAAKNSTYVVRRWDAVQLVAQGNPIQ